MIAWFLSSAVAAPLHFVVISNAQYAEVPPAQSWNPVPAANVAARRMTERLVAMGGTGVRLDSKPGALISRADMLSVIDEQAQRAAKDEDDPLLVVYMMGHGLGEGIAWHHWSIPGELTVPAEADLVHVDDAAVSAAALADRLNDLGVPYLLLLDSCYEGTAETFDSPVLSATATQNLRDVANVLRYMNELHQPNPVVFSAEPGTFVSTVADPTEGSSREVGPLARRFLLATAEVGDRELSLRGVVHSLTDSGFDPLSPAGVSFAEGIPRYRFAAAPGGSVDRRSGSATEGRTILPVSSSGTTTPVGGGTSAASLSFALRVEGVEGDWVTGGSNIEAKVLGTNWPVASDRHEVSFTFVATDGREGTVEIVAPDGQNLQVGTYKKTERAHMGSSKRMGLSLSFDGNACNEARGAVDLQAVEYNESGQLIRLRAVFVHACDGGPPVTGVLDARGR